MSLANLTLLIVEDDSIFNENLSKSLSIIFLKVYSAKDGLEALDIFQNNKVDIILTDFVIPNLDGYEMCKKIREFNKNIPIIMMSCHIDSEKLLKAVKLHLIDYLVKPLQYSQLMNAFYEAEKVINNSHSTIKLKDNVIYNYKSKHLEISNDNIKLTKYEYLLLELLIEYKNQALSYNIIENNVYQKYVGDGVIKNQFARLRKKLGIDIIKNIKEVGYMLCIK
jgi:DNA-binding response OmpR family regulator